MVNSPTSGKPRSAAVPAPVIYTASKPTASAILACSALRTKGATSIGPPCNLCRSVVVIFIGVSLLRPNGPPHWQLVAKGNRGPPPALSLTLSHFVACQHWLRSCTSPYRFSAHPVPRGAPL